MLPPALILLASLCVLAAGWHRGLSLETLIRHRAEIDALVAAHRLAAIAAFVGLYIATVALGIPGAAILSTSAGVVFGAVGGGLAAMTGAVIGATMAFAIARSALGDFMMARAGPRAARLTEGFRRGAFNYLLFLRLVPLFPFWLVNLVPALCGVRLAPFVAATVLGISPVTFAFALFGAGLDTALAAQGSAYRACLASQHQGCRFDFDLGAAVTPELLAALAGVGVLALFPLAARHWRAQRGAGAP